MRHPKLADLALRTSADPRERADTQKRGFWSLGGEESVKSHGPRPSAQYAGTLQGFNLKASTKQRHNYHYL